MDAEGLVPGDDHVPRRVAPGGGLLEVRAERGRVPRVADDGVGRGAEVLLGEQVRVHVVVGDRAVLVGAGDAVDAEAALLVVVAERTPEPGRLDEQLEADLRRELVVPRRVLIAGDGVGDARADVEGRRAGGPGARTL